MVKGAASTPRPKFRRSARRRDRISREISSTCPRTCDDGERSCLARAQFNEKPPQRVDELAGNSKRSFGWALKMSIIGWFGWAC